MEIELYKKYLEDLGVTTPTFIIADAAFALTPIPREKAEKPIEGDMVPKRKVLVGITIRHWNSPGQKGSK